MESLSIIKNRIGKAVFLLAVLATTAGCGANKVNNDLVESSSTSGEFEITPATPTVNPGGAIQFATENSSGNDYYYVSSGSCVINSSTGYMVAPASTGSCTISVSNSSGEISSTVVYVSGTSSVISVTPQAQTVAAGATLTLSASGGTGSYSYVIISGSGTMSGNVFYAPSFATTAYVQVSDSAGNTGGTYIYVSSTATSYVLTNVVIESANSPEVLDVKGKSHSDGATIQQWRYQPSDNANQKWTFTASTNGYSGYTIVSKESSKCVAIDNNYGSPAAKIVQKTCDNGYNQLFTIQGGSNNTFQIKHLNSDLCLEVIDGSTIDGARIQLATCSSSKLYQFWRTYQI